MTICCGGQRRQAPRNQKTSFTTFGKIYRSIKSTFLSGRNVSKNDVQTISTTSKSNAVLNNESQMTPLRKEVSSSSRSSPHKILSQDITSAENEFEVTFEYLSSTNEVVVFKDYDKNLFPDHDAFVNTSRICLNRNANEWREVVDLDERSFLRNGLIKESSLDEAIQRRMTRENEDRRKEGQDDKHFVNPEVLPV